MAWIIGVVATAAAALFACADSALLAFHASETEAPAGAIAERERAHRALSMGRVLGYIFDSLLRALQARITRWSPNGSETRR